MQVVLRHAMIAIAGLLVCLLCSMPLRAEPLDEFSIRVGGYANHFDTTIRVDDPRGRRGSEIDFDRELGLEDRDVIEFISAAWRPWRQHEFGLGYFHQTLAGGRRLERELHYGEETFELDAFAYTALTLQSFEFQYTYWAVLREQWAIGLRFGHIDYRIGTRIETGERGSNERLIVRTGGSVPAPNFGFDLRAELANKWRFNASLGWLEANVDKYSPIITTLRFGVEYLAWENVGLWADFGQNRIASGVDGKDIAGRVEIEEGGVRLGVTYRL